MSVLSLLQQEQVLANIFQQQSQLQSVEWNTELKLLAEKLHLLFNPDLMLPCTDRPLVNAWYKVNDNFILPFMLVSGSNIGGLPLGSIVEPNGHFMEVVLVNNTQVLQVICGHDYATYSDD